MVRPRPRMTLLGMLVLVLIGWGIERLIVTDTEAIEGLLEDARKAVLVRELPRLRPMMDDAFAWGELGPDETVQRLQGYVDRGRPTRIDVNWGPVVPRGDTCIVEADVRVLAYGGLFPVHGRLTFTRTSGGWKLAAAEGP